MKRGDRGHQSRDPPAGNNFQVWPNRLISPVSKKGGGGEALAFQRGKLLAGFFALGQHGDQIRLPQFGGLFSTAAKSAPGA